jgi:hypothetical protein
MAAMSAFVSSALQGSPSRPGLARTLGSELGSDYGSQAEGSLRMIEDALFLHRPSPSHTHLSIDDDGRSAYSEGPFESPAPLPPRVSAALSSLALALAPYASPNPPHLIAGLPNSAYKAPNDDNEEDENVFEEAFAMRKIRWADTTKTSTDRSIPTDFVSESVFGGVDSLSTIDDKPRPADASDKMSRQGAISRLGHGRPVKPAYFRHSSDGSIALAHRRKSSQMITAKPPLRATKSYPTVQYDDPEDDGMWELVPGEDERWVEPRTIPGRLVHDLICLILILMDFVECAVVIVYRIMLDLRHRERDPLL